MPSQLENEYAQEFDAWKSTPTPQTTGQLLRKLQPVIDRGVQANVGPRPSPVLRSRARRLTLDALNTYDPNRARLSTHITNHLKGLRRISRQQSQVVSIPERVSLDRHYLSNSEQELQDKLGREPTPLELADHTGISVARINYVRKFRPPVAEGSLLAAMETGPEESAFLPAVEHDNTPVLLEAVYRDLDGTSQKIMDWTLGLHGSTPLSNQEIARKLKLTPGAVSQRKALIQRRIGELEEYGLF